MIFFNEKSSGLGGSFTELLPFYFMWSKIKEFFSKFWWIVLIPIALFVIHTVFRKETPELDKLIKDKQNEIKETYKEVEKAKSEVEKAKEDLESKVEDIKVTVSEIKSDVKERDEKSQEFFR